MKRRESITLLGGAAVAWPIVARAQQPAMPVVGFLNATSLDGYRPMVNAFGPNLRMEIRWGGGNVNRASVFAKELVALQPDVILAQGTPVTAALKGETRTIPIVFATVLAKRRAETYDYVETC